jgi:hypothetical protein
MSQSYYKLSDPNLMLWAQNVTSVLDTSASSYFLTPDVVSAFDNAAARFTNALETWREPTTRTPVASQSKREAREALIEQARHVVNTINSDPRIADTQREAIGIRPRSRPKPIPRPSHPPEIIVESVVGNVVNVRLRGQSGRARPQGVAGASLFTAVGNDAPTDVSGWTFWGISSLTKLAIEFDQSAAAQTVWVTANWYNERGQTSTVCQPVMVNLPAQSIVPVVHQRKVSKLAA